MTWIHITAETIADLGVSLEEVAVSLEETKDGSAERWAFGYGEGSLAFDHLLKGWRQNRVILAESLRSLGEAARLAGVAYVESEEANRRQVGGLL